jgi:hypothetical protein
MFGLMRISTHYQIISELERDHAARLLNLVDELGGINESMRVLREASEQQAEGTQVQVPAVPQRDATSGS